MPPGTSDTIMSTARPRFGDGYHVLFRSHKGVKDTYVYYNHYQGNAAKNAKTLQGFFGLVRQGIWDSTAPDRDRLTDRGQGPVTRRRTGSLRLRILEIEVAREPILTRKRKEPIW